MLLDHCQLTGKYRGVAHNACNLNYSFTSGIPAVTRKLHGYGSQELGKLSGVPITRFSTFDLSKILMYGFHHNYIELKYNSKATLLFTDTDSLCYNVRIEDID